MQNQFHFLIILRNCFCVFFIFTLIMLKNFINKWIYKSLGAFNNILYFSYKNLGSPIFSYIFNTIFFLISYNSDKLRWSVYVYIMQLSSLYRFSFITLSDTIFFFECPKDIIRAFFGMMYWVQSQKDSVKLVPV